MGVVLPFLAIARRLDAEHTPDRMGTVALSVTAPLLHDWETWQYARNLSPRTVTERSATIVRFASEVECDPTDASSAQVVRWLAGHTEWRPGTRATYYAYLCSWFGWLQVQEHRADNPMLKVGAPKVARRSPRPVPDAHLINLLRTRMHHRTRVMILLAALAGLRVHEIAKLRGEDVDVIGELLRVDGKGGVSSILPLHPLLLEVAATMPRKGWWFPANSTRPGKHAHSRSISQIVGRTMQRADVPGTPHALRHWFGTTLVDDGANLETVRELLRHASLEYTQIYVRAADHHRAEAIGRLDPFRAGPQAA